MVRLRDLAADPSKLLAATRLALAEVAHPHWLVFENREGSDGDPRPTEADVQAFLKLREALGADATVVDAVILGERQLWSLHDVLAPGRALCAAGQRYVDGAGSFGPRAFSTCSSRRALQPAICTGGTV